jgi:LPS-assembly protein
VEDGSPEGSEFGFEGDAATRPNADRYWFRMKHNRNLPNDFFAMLDLDVVSDQDYLREFREGLTGFNDTQNQFLGTYGRELDDYIDPVRLNRLNISRIWSSYSFNAEARWYDDVIARRQGTPPGTNSVLQRLPSVEFTALRQPISRFFSFDLAAEYNHFYRENGTRGHRADLYPRVYMPLRFRPYLSIEPSAGYRQTAWHIDSFENEPFGRERTEHRGIYDFRLDLFSELSRIYSAPFEGIDRVRHSVRPRFIYDYVPEQDQTRFPQFDPLDRIGRENMLTYSLTNTWTARMRQIPGRSAAPAYLTFLRLYLEQRYDFNETGGEDPRPFSPIRAEVILSPASLLSLQADAEWSPYEDRFISRNIAATFWNNRRDRLVVEHRYTADAAESLYADLLVNLGDRVAGYVEYEENLLTRTRLRQGVGFMYTRQCWSVDLGFAEEEDDRRFTVMVNLFGIGGIGTPFVGRVFQSPFARFQNRSVL